MNHMISGLSTCLLSGLLLVSVAAGAQELLAPPANTPSATPPAAAAASEPSDLARTLAQIKDPSIALQAAMQFRARGDLSSEAEAWARAVQLRPHLGRYKFELAAAHAQQDHKREAYSALIELQTQGYAYDPRADQRFEKIATTEVWNYILQGMDANRQPFGEGKVVRTLPKQDLLIESLAWDPSRKQLLAGGAREGAVYRVGEDGELAPFITANEENGMWAVFDLLVDDKRGVLWVASTAVPHFRHYKAETDLGRAGIFKFDLKSGKFLKKFLSPSIAGQSFFLSTLALGNDGEIYAADGVNNAVYMVRDDKFRRLFHAPLLASIRGLAVSGDGKTLYLADHERGLIGFELGSGRPFDIPVPPTLALGGIDGLAWWKGHLILVQNDMLPNRIMRLQMSDDGRSIGKVQPLAANQASLTLPTLGTLAGDHFYLIANSQKDNYDRFGLLKDASKLEPIRIFAVDVDYQPPTKSDAADQSPAEQSPAEQ